MLIGFITTTMKCVHIVRDERRLLVFFIFPVDLAAADGGGGGLRGRIQVFK